MLNTILKYIIPRDCTCLCNTSVIGGLTERIKCCPIMFYIFNREQFGSAKENLKNLAKHIKLQAHHVCRYYLDETENCFPLQEWQQNRLSSVLGVHDTVQRSSRKLRKTYGTPHQNNEVEQKLSLGHDTLYETVSPHLTFAQQTSVKCLNTDDAIPWVLWHHKIAKDFENLIKIATMP